MSKKKIQYYIRYTCDTCGQSWYDPNSYLAKELAEGEDKSARLLFYGEHPNSIKSGSKVVDRVKRHDLPYECVAALKTYIDEIRLEFDDRINNHISINHSYY